MNVKMFRDIDELKIWGNEHGFRFHRDPDDKTKYKACLTDDDVDKLETFVRQQQAEIEALKAGKIRAYDNGVEDGRKPNTNLVKDLEDIDINITWNENSMRDFGKDELNFARAILRKAQEK